MTSSMNCWEAIMEENNNNMMDRFFKYMYLEKSRTAEAKAFQERLKEFKEKEREL